MNEITNQVVEAKSKDGKKIMIGPDWFSAFNASTLEGVERGDTVSFVYTLKGDWKNIKGSVRKGEGTATDAIAPIKSSTPHFSRGNFPIHPLDGQRSIIRQNSLTNSVATAKLLLTGEEDVAVATDFIISIAREFEKYSAGDLDREAAEAELKELTKVVR